MTSDMVLNNWWHLHKCHIMMNCDLNVTKLLKHTHLHTNFQYSVKRVLNAAARASSPALGSLTVAWVRYCMKNFTGSTSPTRCYCFSSWHWHFTDVWTAAHHRTCRTTASRSPVLTLGGICVPPTVNYLQYLATGSTLTAIGPFQLPAPQSGTLSGILSGTRPSVPTVSDVCLKRIYSLDTSVFSTLEVLDDNRAI